MKFEKFNFSLPQKWLLKFYLFVASNAYTYRVRLIETLENLKVILANETEQTKDMLSIYILQSQGRAKDYEILRANRQFRDLIRGMGFGVILILPFSPITLPLLVRLGRKLGVEILPDSIRDFTSVRTTTKTPPKIP